MTRRSRGTTTSTRLVVSVICMLSLLLSAQAQFEELILRLRKPVPIKVAFTTSEYTVSEDVGVLEVCLEVDLGLPIPTTVQITSYQTDEQDSALATLDFEPSVRTIVFPRSLAPTSVCINHTTIVDDQLAAEGLEWFSLSLEVTSETMFGEREFEVVVPVSKTRVTILDNDDVIVEFTQTNLTVDEGEGVVDVCISVDTPTATPISFFIEAVESSPISAIAHLDFTPDQRTVTIPPSNITDTTCVSFSILKDKLAFEGQETFSVQLLPPIQGIGEIQLGAITTATVYILDNDNVTLTVGIVERPEAVRPITGETVVFSCEIRSSSGLLWQSSTIEDIVFVRAIHDVNEVMSDGDADAVAVLTFESPNVLMSTLTFSNVTGGGVLNQTDFFCVSADDPNTRNVERVTLAGIPSPPINVTVENRTCNCLHVTWTTPLYNGDAPLLYTQLQFNDTSNSSAALRNLRTQSGGVKSVEVCDLVPNVLYLGSVWAVNRVGVSASVEVELLITAKVPSPPGNFEAKSSCVDSTLCLDGTLTFSWNPPETDLLCPVYAVHLDYSVTHLEALINSTTLVLDSHVTSYTFSSIAPGRSYVGTIAFENEVGLSMANHSVREDVLLFGSVQLRKLTSRSTIFEGDNAIYSARLNGPPPNSFSLDFNNLDDFTRILTPQLYFNSSLWYQQRDIIVMATDDDIIRDSPYGAVVSIGTMSERPKYNDKSINLSLVIQDTDDASVMIVPKEAYPDPTNIPEGRWSVYLVSLPNRPSHTLTIVYHTATPTITLSPFQMTFEPEAWNIPQELTVIAIDDSVHMASTYRSGFNLTLLSDDKNYGGITLPEFNVTINDNDNDAAVISGTLTWKSATDEYGRAAVLFTVSLVLDSSYYPNINTLSVGVANISLPGSFDHGTGADYLRVVGLYRDYVIASGQILHRYQDYDDSFSLAEYEYCCRGESLRNNQGTMFTLRVGVDLTQTTSPTLPLLPRATLTPSQPSQPFYYSALHGNGHPLVYYLGDATNYQSSQGGAPQWLDIDYATGHVTWDSDRVTPGDYSVQVIVEDIFTGITTSSEFLVRVPTRSSYSPPTIVTSSTPPTHYIAPGYTLSTNFTVLDSDSILGVRLDPVLLLPEGARINRQIITGANSVVYEFLWEPTEDQIGEYILCFVSTDGYDLSSTPSCLSVIVTETDIQQPSLSLTGSNDPAYSPTYTRGIDQSVPIASVNSTLLLSTTSPLVHHMSVRIINQLDGQYESIEVANQFLHPSLTFGRSERRGNDVPSVVFFSGMATSEVYLEALQNLVYVNSKSRPTVGDRMISVIVYDGQSTNQDAYTVVTVAIQNTEPIVRVNGDENAYLNRFFPHEGPVAVVNPANAVILDSDSQYIQSMTLQLHNVRNGPSEILTVTYVTPETLSLPIIAEATQLNIPFGTLWRGEEVPAITSTLHVYEMGVVGHLSVVIDIRHSWIGDLKIELEHNGRRELLVLNPGGHVCDQDNLFRATFESQLASSNIYLSKSTSSPGVCEFRSEGVFTADGELDNFHGDAIEGDWMLHVTDLLLENDNGRLFGWSLGVQPEEIHALISHPPVLPPLKVGGARSGIQESHEKTIELDGRIIDISVHVQLGMEFTAEQLFLPTLTLVHPDGSHVILSYWSTPFCAIGNYTNLVFNDRGQQSRYSCESILNPMSGSGSSSGSGMGVTSASGTLDQVGSGMPGSSFGMSGSGSGGSGMSLSDGMYLNLDDIFNLNITIPYKYTQIDLLNPTQPLSNLRGKMAGGKWTLKISSGNMFKSTLYGWSLRIAREPNINENFDPITNTLYLTGDDSVANYQTVLRSIVYDNRAAEPNFSIERLVTTVVSDGDTVSNVSLPTSISTITVHHVEIDLDPLNTTAALTPDYSVTFREHSSPIPILDPYNAVLRDANYNVGRYILTVTLKGYQNVGEEGLLLNTSVVSGLHAVFTNNTITEEFIVTVTADVLQPIDKFETVLRTFEYFNNAEEFVGAIRTVEFSVTDLQMSSFFVSDVAVVAITLQPTNDLPILLLNSDRYTLSDQFSNIVDYTEGQNPVALTNATSIVLTDNDHNYLLSVTITIANPQDPSNEFLQANTTGSTITFVYNLTTYTLVLSGMETLSNYIDVLGTVTYENTVHSPGMPGTEPRQVNFVPFDGTHYGLPAISLVTFAAVNDPAFGDLNGGDTGTGFATVYTEERGRVLIVSENTTLYDVDDNTLAYIDVQITNILDAPFEILSVMNVEESSNINSKVVEFTNLRPVTMYDPNTGNLRISGLDTIREYQEVLKTLTYDNLADEPTQVTREIVVTLNDSRSISLPLIIQLEIELVNDSPYFNQQLSPIRQDIYEDIPNAVNYGVTVLEIAELIIDDDLDSVKGVAVIGLDANFGDWQYTTDGFIWNQIAPNVSINFALALEATIGMAIRFVPGENLNGIVTVTLAAWDTTDNSVSESYINAQSDSNIDAFSSDSTVVTVIVRPVNDAPVLQPVPLNITTRSEDNLISIGDPITSLVEYISDIDVPTEFGIAVISVDQENGAWQFTTNGGGLWEEFGEVNETSALLLHSLPEGMLRVRFVPRSDFNGQAVFLFRAWDLTRLPIENIDIGSTMMESGSGVSSGVSSGMGSGSGSGFGSGMFSDGGLIMNETILMPYPSGTRLNISMSDPITGPFSVASTSVTIAIEPLNDSPIVQPGMTLGNITEDIDLSFNHGTMVADIISGLYTDIDANPDRGLAIVSVDDRYGDWQYTCQSPSIGNWSIFIGGMYYGQIIPRLPQPERATLLLSSCWIRFLPNQFFNSELNTDGYPRLALPYIEAYGWDNTGATAGRSGTYGNDATYASDSTSNEYSARSEKITIQVISLNNVPILRLSDQMQAEYNTVFVEDQLPVYAVGRDLTLIDNDHARLRDITVMIYGSEFDVSPFDSLTFSGDGISGSGVMQGSGSGSAMSGFSSGSGSGLTSSGVDPLNEYVPVISSTPSYPPLNRVQEYVRNLNAPTNLELYCSGLTERREELLVQTTSPDLISEVISYCPYVLRLSANPEISPDAHKDMFQLALRSLRYNNSIEEPMGGDRTLTFVVSDNIGLSEPVNSTIFVRLVNDLPQLDLNMFIPDVHNFVSYTEGQGSLLLTNETKLGLIDTDNLYLQSARVVLVEAPDADNEILNATVDGTDLSIDFNTTTYTLTISGNATKDTYAQVLSTVSYTNNYSHPGNPDERQRQIQFYVNDGLNDSRVAITFVSFAGVNNRPYLDVNGNEPGVNYVATFIEEQGPVSIVDQNVLVHDEDNTTLAYIRVELLDEMEMFSEFLSVDNVTLTKVLEESSLNAGQALLVTTLVPNMTYDAVYGTLTISGLGTVEEYQLVLRTIKYNNIFDEPAPICRTIRFTANDGELDSEPVYTEVCVEAFNDSPFFNTTFLSVYSPLILEDEFANEGVLVAMFAYQLFSDEDIQSMFSIPGIGVVEVESDHGEWESSTDGGNSWMLIRPDTDIQSLSLLLSAELDGDNLVRFVPELNYHGNASLTFVLWDGSDGMSPGDTRSALSTSHTSPFSNDTRTLVLRIVPVNDAPVIDSTVEPQMTTIREDSVRERESIGDQVSAFLIPLTEDVDVNIMQHHFGIAVTSVDISNGYWQFSVSGGLNWTNVTNPSVSNAIVLNSEPADVNRIRFVPDLDFNGEAWFQFKLWDRNVTWPSGTEGVDTRTNPVTGTFSVGIATARLTIEPVNDSPLLSGPSSLDEIVEDVVPGANIGTFVNQILRDTFIDIDGTDTRGLAVVYVDRRYGNWQYTCDPFSATSWIDFRGERLVFDTDFGQVAQIAPRDPNEYKATLLSGEDDSLCRIRFVPSVNYNSEFDADGFARDPNDHPFIRIRGWDGTSGSSEDEGVDTTSSPDDHTDAFGRDFIPVTVDVLTINDNAMLRLNGEFPNYMATFVEAVPPQRTVIPVPVTNQQQLSLTDPDNSLIAYVNIFFTPYDGENERLILNVTGTSLNYTLETLNEPSGLTYIVRILPTSGETAPIGEFETVLRTVLYENSAEEPDPTLRVITFTVNDGLGFSVVRTELYISLLNDPPQLDLAMNWPDSYRFVSYREGQGPLVIVNDNATLIDFDSPVLKYARVVVVIAPDKQHELLNAESNSTINVIRNGSEIVLQGPASVDDFLAVIKTVSYENTLSHPGDPSPLSRTIQFTVSDGMNESIPAFVYLSFGTINNAPFFDANGRQPGVGNLVTFYEEQGPISIVSQNAVLEDIDNATLKYIQVSIVNPLDADNEVLFVDDVTETSAPLTSKQVMFFNFRPEQRYDTDTATLTITGLETVYEFQEVLKTLKYNNIADEPDNENRMIQFVISDGSLNTTGVYVTIELEHVNDSPYFNSSATIFSPSLDEDVHTLLNPGWSIENVVSNGLILDDDANSLQGIAITSADTSDGYWEVTWDYTTDRNEFFSGMGSGDENGMESGFSGLQPSSGSGSVISVDGSGDSNGTFGGTPTGAISGSGADSGSGSMMSSSGSGMSGSGMSGSGILGSGDSTEAPPTPPPPKCMSTTPPTSPDIQPTFYATWYRLPNTTSITMATLLRVEDNRTRIRFIPIKDFNGQTSFGFVAWDVSNNLDNGVVTNATSNSGIDSFSSSSVQIILNVLPVNDAPLLYNITVQLTPIEEDDITSSGNDISDFLSGVSDIDVLDTTLGIAIVKADETKGAWQFTTDGGRVWTTMYDVCPYNATVLSSEPPGQNRIRFMPNRDFNGFVSFSFLTWDLTSSEPSGTMAIDTTSSDRVTGAFSTTYAMATIRVDPVNDSPVLTPGSRLQAILEDLQAVENEGTLVWDIVDGFYHDVDSQSARGIAVRGVDLRYGTWEWKCPDTDTWTKFFGDFLYGVFVPPNPRPEKATLLDGDCSVRFLPNLNFNTLRDTNGDLRPLTDYPYITVVAWDTTVGSAGEYGVDTTIHNDSIINEYSGEVENVIIEIISVNDHPQVNISQEGVVYLTNFTEEQLFVKIVQPVYVSITDADHARLESITIVVSNSNDPTTEVVFFDTDALNDSNIEVDQNTNTITVTTTDRDGMEITEAIQVLYHIYTGAQNSAPSSLTLTAPPGRERVKIASYQYLLQFVVYSNMNSEPNNETRLINFYFDDSEDVNSMVTTEVEILLLNDNPPVLYNPLTGVQFTEDSGVLLSLSSYNLTLTDFDHNEYFFMSNATISLYPIPTSSLENVSVQISSNFNEYNISQSYSSEEGILRITGRAPILVYESIILTAVYQNSIEEPLPGDRLVTMQVFDGDNCSNVQRVRISVILINDQVPMVATSNESFVFTERTRPVAISNGLIVTDQDSGDFLLSRVVVTIDNPLDNAYEILSVSDFDAVNSTYNGSTLLLEGPASVAEFQAILSTLSYNNMAEEPSPVTRNISIIVYDEDFESERGLIQVIIQLVNDIPLIAIPPHELMVNYIEGSGQVAIAANVTISDNDHTELTQLTAVILNPLDQPNEFLSISIPNGTNITSEYNPDNGLLILSGIASLDDYQTTLRSLSYENLEANPGFPDTAPRMIQVIAFDGSNYSLPLELLLTFDSVNDPPMLDLNGAGQGTNYTTSFIEEDMPVFITSPDAVLFDIDNTSLTFVRVTIENLEDGDNEILSVSANTSEELDLAFYSYDNGVLLIEGLGETVSFERAVASVTYQNLADEPSYATRVISFVASDGLIDSDLVYSNVEIIPVNDPPRLYIAGGRRTSPLPTEMPTEPTTGSGEMSADGSGGVSESGSGTSSASGSGTMSASGSGFTGLEVGSGMDPTTLPTTELPPQPTVDPDSILGNVTIGDSGNYSVIFIENSPPVTIVDINGTLVEDDDDAILIRFEAILNGVQDSGFEAIFFDSNALSNELVAALFSSAPSMNGFLGNDMTCVAGNTGLKHERIDINISLGILEWEEVVRSLRYCNGDEHPVSGSRNITFRIQDQSMAWSNVETTILEVVAVNDAPICTTIPNLFTIDEDTNLTITALRNCFDHEETLTPTSIFVFAEPSKGQVVLDATTGDLVFIPMLDDYGTRTFVYQACDSTMFCSNPQMVTVVINPVNDAPYAFNNLIISTPEDTLLIIQLSQFFGDVEDDLIPNNRYPRVNRILNTPLATTGLENDQNSTFMYEPNQDYFGPDVVVLQVCDSDDVCVTITIEVMVISVNDAPVIQVLYPEGTAPAATVEDQAVMVEVMITEVEDREPVEVRIVAVGDGTAHTSSTTSVFQLGTDRLLQTTTIVYTPNQDFHGNDTITIAAIDSDNGYTEAVISVSVSYVNDPPFFGITELTIVEDMVMTWRLPHDLQITDPENTLHAGSFEIIQNATLGNVTYNITMSDSGTNPAAYGILTYYPPEHYFTDTEPVTFVLRACDNDTMGPRLCTDAVINITILSDNDAPHLPPLTVTICEDGVSLTTCNSGVNVLNIWEQITDVEEGRPPMENVFLMDPLPERGVATYDPSSGYITYVPHLNDHGIDYIFYNACDSENHCSALRGQIEVTILQINDPPQALEFVHISREDDFDLISFIDQISDIETANLRLEIVTPEGTYLDETTTSIGGNLRVYHAHQILTYEPPANYVGPDTFTYAVCDNCDPRRDDELGRVDPDPECTRQIEQNGGTVSRSDGVYITCTQASVTIVVANVNDVPVIGDIAVSTTSEVTVFLTPFESSRNMSDLPTPSYLYLSRSTPVFDSDDEQLYQAVTNNLNLTLYGLQLDSDINETSLNLRSSPENGVASIVTVDNITRILYVPNPSFSGYEQFSYQICDKQRFPMDEPRCAEGVARVWVTKEGPQIVSVVANGAETEGESILDTDSKVSAGDSFLITFSEDTNLPPHGVLNTALTWEHITNIFTFSQPFFIDNITPSPLQGAWISPTQLQLTIIDEGYPVPFITEVQNGVEVSSEIQIGQWTISVSETVSPCGGFDDRGQLLTDLSDYCLQTADTNSFHSNSSSPALEGDFGLKLPDVSNIVLSNTGIDDKLLDSNEKNLLEDSQISIHFQQPLSYTQLQKYCQMPVTDLIDVSKLGSNVELQLVGCANLLADGTVAEEVYATEIELMKQIFTKTSRRKRQVTMDTASERERRQATSGAAAQPVTSEIVLQVVNIVNPTVDPTKDPQGFVNVLTDSINQMTLAQVIADSHNIDIQLLLGDVSNGNTAPQLDPFYYFESDDDLTPLISRVVASDPDNVDDVYGANDLITIFFDRSTDQPTVTTRTNIDKILIFDPSLGADYTGLWVSPSVLQITIVDPALGENVVRPSTSPLIFSLSFTPNYFHTGTEVTSSNAILPTQTPWCVGVNVCGDQTTNGGSVTSIGICNDNQQSCRAYQGWTSLEGNFGTGVPVVIPVFPFWWIIIAILAIIVIVGIIVTVVLVYRYYKRKSERKEALRVVKRWKKEQFTPGVEPATPGPKPWVKPPDVSTMRENPDPFNIFKRLPEVVPRPATALTEVENLPPVPQQPFKPRGGASIRPSLSSLGTAPPLPRISRTISGASLPPALGLPPLSKLPSPTPGVAAPERRTTLPPLRGGAIGTQARRALGDTTPHTSGSTLPGQLLPRSLPPMRLPLSPTSPGAPPFIGKGKGPLSGRPVIKKSPPTSSEEDISGSEMVGAGSGSALPTITSPPFKTTRPLPSLGLPPIGGASLPPIRTSGNGPLLHQPMSPVAMPSRRTSIDPFAADSIGPTRRTTPSTLGPFSLPTTQLRNPLARSPPIPLMPGAPPTSPRRSLAPVTRALSVVSEEAKKETDDSQT